MPRVAAFWTLGAILLAFLFAASAPSPLYVVYQARWGFSAATLTTVFAVYALALLVVTPCLVATWALGGLYLSLGPSLAAGVLHIQSHLIGGLVIFALAGMGVVGSLALRDGAPRRVMVVGSVVLAAGAGVTLLALALTSTVLFFLGTAIAGFGFGAAFLGAFRTLSVLAEPGERAELFATVYVVNYLAFSLPAIAAGLAVSPLGLQRTATVYGVVVILFAVSAVLGLSARRPREASRTATATAPHAAPSRPHAG